MSIQSEINRIGTAISDHERLIGEVVTALAERCVVTEPILQSKTVTPTEEVQVITPDAGYDGLSSVTVEAAQGGEGTYGWKKCVSGLPSGYTEIEYIESSGTQYIDTGWKPTSMNFEIEAQFRITGTATDQTIFGASQGASEGGLILNLMVGTNLWQLGVNNVWTSATHSSCAANKDLSVVVKGSSTGTTLTVNGELVTTNTQTTCAPTDNVHLFSAYKTSANILYPATARMYRVKARDNGNLVRDYIPCTNVGETAGMYDLVDSAFYANAGSGSFAVGPTASNLSAVDVIGYVVSDDADAYPDGGFLDGYYYEKLVA